MFTRIKTCFILLLIGSLLSITFLSSILELNNNRVFAERKLSGSSDEVDVQYGTLGKTSEASISVPSPSIEEPAQSATSPETTYNSVSTIMELYRVMFTLITTVFKASVALMNSMIIAMHTALTNLMGQVITGGDQETGASKPTTSTSPSIAEQTPTLAPAPEATQAPEVVASPEPTQEPETPSSEATQAPEAVASPEPTQKPAPKQPKSDNSNSSFPEKFFAPYIDISLDKPQFSISDCESKTGLKYYTLAFLTASGQDLAWAGNANFAKDFYMDEIDKIRAKGGDVILSFGGASGEELACVVSDPVALQMKYQDIIDRYQIKWVDFDIEGPSISNKIANTNRSKAIKKLQENNPDLKVAFCLPVTPTEGLGADALDVLKDAKANDVRVDVVNIMAMDYGPYYAPAGGKSLGNLAISAAEKTYKQCTDLGLNAKIGITPMIGLNDIKTEIFVQQDAKDLLSWAQKTDYVAMLSMWSASRDNGSTGKQDVVSPISSSLEQSEYEFTNIFKNIVGK